jgi:hypothetical protein
MNASIVNLLNINEKNINERLKFLNINQSDIAMLVKIHK